MKKQKEGKLFLYIFLVVFFIFVGFITSNRKRVLVVHSYNPEFSWVSEMNEEFNRVLPSSDVDVRFHYMDTKRHPDPEFKEKAGEETRSIIDSWDPDVIILVDDNAQEFVGTYYIGAKRPYIVYAGVNAKPETYGYAGASNVTGILERTPVDSIVEIMLHSFPESRRFLHISDSSPTSKAIHEEYHSKDWSPLVCEKAVMVDTFDEWKKEILAAGGKADFILYTHYHTIRRSRDSKEVVPPAEVLSWAVANSNIPGIGNWGFFVEDGGMMSIAVSAQEQAAVASNYTKKLLSGESIDQLPIAQTSKYSVYLNKKRLNRLGVKLPMVYTLLAETAGHMVD